MRRLPCVSVRSGRGSMGVATRPTTQIKKRCCRTARVALGSQESAEALSSLSVHRNLALRLTRRCWRWDTTTLQNILSLQGTQGPVGDREWGGPGGVKPSALSRSTDPEHAGVGRRALFLDRCVPADALCLDVASGWNRREFINSIRVERILLNVRGGARLPHPSATNTRSRDRHF